MSRRKGEEPRVPSSTAGREARGHRFDEVMEALREIGHIMGMQAQERAAAYAQAAEAVPIAGVGGNRAHPG